MGGESTNSTFGVKQHRTLRPNVCTVPNGHAPKLRQGQIECRDLIRDRHLSE